MKRLLKSLKGFPVGNCVLLLTYILIYALEGNGTFANEIVKFTEFKYLLGQVVFSGIAFVAVDLSIRILLETTEKGEETTRKDVFVMIASYAAIAAVALIASALIARRGTLAGYVGSIFRRISAIIVVVSAIVYVVYNMIQSTKINKALKEKQTNKDK